MGFSGKSFNRSELNRRKFLQRSVSLSAAMVPGLSLAGGFFAPVKALAAESPQDIRHGADIHQLSLDDLKLKGLFAGARKDSSPLSDPLLPHKFNQNSEARYSAALFNRGGDVRSVVLPGRGHDVAVRPLTEVQPSDVEVVAFARRPGRFAVAFSTNQQKPPHYFDAAPDRHFYGHGVFSPDGKLLYSTENDYENGVGVIGVRDATGGYLQIGELSTHGVGPHDMALLDDGITLVIANGGIETSPETGRQILNLAEMEPSLVYIDRRNGDLLEKVKLSDDLRQLSIRHLTVAGKNRVTFGCQYKGAKTDQPQLIGFHDRGGPVQFVTVPDEILRQMNNYVGSVAVDKTGEMIAASCPRGNLITFFNASSRSYVGARRMKDGCGLAQTSKPNGFLLTNGYGDVAEIDGKPANGNSEKIAALLPDEVTHLKNIQWDNHAVKVL